MANFVEGDIVYLPEVDKCRKMGYDLVLPSTGFFDHMAVIICFDHRHNEEYAEALIVCLCQVTLLWKYLNLLSWHPSMTRLTPISNTLALIMRSCGVHIYLSSRRPIRISASSSTWNAILACANTLLLRSMRSIRSHSRSWSRSRGDVAANAAWIHYRWIGSNGARLGTSTR